MSKKDMSSYTELKVADFDFAVSEKAPTNKHGGKNINASYKGGAFPALQVLRAR